MKDIETKYPKAYRYFENYYGYNVDFISVGYNDTFELNIDSLNLVYSLGILKHFFLHHYLLVEVLIKEGRTFIVNIYSTKDKYLLLRYMDLETDDFDKAYKKAFELAFQVLNDNHEEYFRYD